MRRAMHGPPGEARGSIDSDAGPGGHPEVAGGSIVIRAVPADCAVALELLAQAAIGSAVFADSAPEAAVLLATIAIGQHACTQTLREIAGPLAAATRRQLLLLQHFSLGRSTKSAQAGLGISPTTYKRDVAKLESLLQVRGRISLAVTACRLGFPTRCLPSPGAEAPDQSAGKGSPRAASPSG